MKKEVSHRGALRQIIRDERLSPHRRLLAEMLHLWLDCENEEDKKGLFNLIQVNYGKSSFVKWSENPDLKQNLGKIELEATAKLREYFSKIEEEVQEKQDEISGQSFQPTS